MAERRRSWVVTEDGRLDLSSISGMIAASDYGLKGAGYGPHHELRREALLGNERGFDGALSVGGKFEKADEGNRRTLLELAVEGGNTNIVRRLLQAGRPMLSQAASEAGDRHPVWTAVELNDRPMAELLLDAGAPEWRRERRGSGAHDRHLLHGAVMFGSPDVVRLLLDRGLDPNVSTPEGHTPLMFTSEHHGEEIVEMLITYGADVHRVSPDGVTPLGALIRDRRSDLFKVLARGGANPMAEIPMFQQSAFAYLHGQSDIATYRALLEAFPTLMSDPSLRTAVFFRGLAQKDLGLVRIAIEAGADLKDVHEGKTVMQALGRSKAAEPIRRELNAMKIQRRIESAFDDGTPDDPAPSRSSGPMPL